MVPDPWTSLASCATQLHCVVYFVCFQKLAHHTDTSAVIYYSCYYLQYRDGVGYTVDDNSSVFSLIMVTLHSRCGHSILPLWFLLLFSSPILSSRRLDVHHISIHDVGLVHI